MDNERLKKQMDFILEMDKMKSIMRQTYLANGERKENDAEHSWHLALMCGILAEYSNEPIDVLKTMKMVLLHDAIEIDAGDTYAYDAAGNQTKKEREQKAADRIFPILPEDMAKEYRNLWEEFEESRTPEAKFAHTMDNLQPAMLNVVNNGVSWKEHGIAISQIMKRNAHTAEGSQVLWDYAYENFFKKNIDDGNIIDDSKKMY